MQRTTVRLAWIAVAVAATACGDATPTTTSAPTANVTTGCTVAPTMSVGQVVTGLSGTGLCFAAINSGGEFALIPYNASSSSATTAFTTTFTGTTSSALSSVSSLTTSSTSFLTSGARASRVPTFEQKLRASERATLPRLMSAARAWRNARTSGNSSGARFSISSTATVGQLVQLNANANDACANPAYRTGQIMAIGSRAIVVADTSNPSGGFTQSDYVGIAAAFDTLIDPTDRLNFGDPTDIDNNGHVVLFFTRAVNELTPANSDSYTAGFFFARDLFPSSGTNACAGSNVGEMFYLMVADPTGAINRNIFTKSEVDQAVLGTVAHEYQHLINASRRLYVNNATDFEETFLDEGLSHIAEELLFYKSSGLAPGADLTATTLRTSQQYVDAVNTYEVANLGRYAEYLSAPDINSPFAPNDSLATRGATWSLLRYLADRAGGTQSTYWHALVNSTTTGLANLENVFGADVPTLTRDWGISLLTDDLVTTASAYTQPSWNFRSLFPALGVTSFPLETHTPLVGAPTTVNLTGAGSAFLRFGVTAGQSASIVWDALPATISVALVRTK